MWQSLRSLPITFRFLQIIAVGTCTHVQWGDLSAVAGGMIFPNHSSLRLQGYVGLHMPKLPVALACGSVHPSGEADQIWNCGDSFQDIPVLGAFNLCTCLLHADFFRLLMLEHVHICMGGPFCGGWWNDFSKSPKPQDARVSGTTYAEVQLLLHVGLYILQVKLIKYGVAGRVFKGFLQWVLLT